MKKVFLTLCAFLAVWNTASAQKQQLADLITENSKWVYAYAFEKAVTLNTSGNMWAMLQDKNKSPKGYVSFRILGDALLDLSDQFNDTDLEAKCGTGVNIKVEESNKPECKSAIDNWKEKYSVTINAQSVSANSEGYRLLNGYTTTLAELFNSGSRSLARRGYKPKADKQHFIINMDNKYKDVMTYWSKDGTTFTINAPATNEVGEWDRKIENGLKAGWVKK